MACILAANEQAAYWDRRDPTMYWMMTAEQNIAAMAVAITTSARVKARSRAVLHGRRGNLIFMQGSNKSLPHNGTPFAPELIKQIPCHVNSVVHALDFRFGGSLIRIMSKIK